MGGKSASKIKVETRVDKRIESEESEDEGKKQAVRLVTDLSQQSLRDEQNGEAETPVDMETISLDPEAEDVDLNHFRIGKIEGFEVLKKVKTLCLRQNLVKRIENLEQLQTLRELDRNEGTRRRRPVPAAGKGRDGARRSAPCAALPGRRAGPRRRPGRARSVHRRQRSSSPVPTAPRGRGRGPAPGIPRARLRARGRSREAVLVLQVQARLLEQKGLRGAGGAAAGRRLREVGRTWQVDINWRVSV